MADTSHQDPLDTAQLTLPVLPLPNGVVLPGMVLTIALESDEAKAAVAATGDDDRLLLVPKIDGRHADVGTIATIESTGQLPSGAPALVVRAHERAVLRAGVAGTGTVLWLQAEPVHPEVTDEARELAGELRAAFRELFEQMGGRRLAEVLRGLDEPDALADAAGWWPDLSLERKVELLETIDVAERVRRVLAWVKEALAEHAVQERIRSEVSDGLEKNQREFILRQQLTAIRKELGELDDEGGEATDSPAAYRAKLAGSYRSTKQLSVGNSEMRSKLTSYERTLASARMIKFPIRQTPGASANMRATKIILSLITAAALMASLSSCSLDPIANKDKSVYVVGDSITMSVTWGDNDAFVKQAPSGYSAKVDAFMGKQIADYQADVAKYSGQNVPERLVIQLGTNNANNGDGWTAQDTADYQKVVTTAPDRTCIVAIVPSAGSQATPEIKTNMGVAAQAIRGIMAKESKKVVLEFSDFQKAHPEFVTVDGIHLATQENPALKPAIVKAYTDWVWAGTKNCVGGPRK